MVLACSGLRLACPVGVVIEVAPFCMAITGTILLYHAHLLGWLDVPVALNTGIAFCALRVAICCVRPDTWLMSFLLAEACLPGQ